MGKYTTQSPPSHFPKYHLHSYTSWQMLLIWHTQLMQQLYCVVQYVEITTVYS